jgi:hypothetical protein
MGVSRLMVPTHAIRNAAIGSPTHGSIFRVVVQLYKNCDLSVGSAPRSHSARYRYELLAQPRAPHVRPIQY